MMMMPESGTRPSSRAHPRPRTSLLMIRVLAKFENDRHRHRVVDEEVGGKAGETVVVNYAPLIDMGSITRIDMVMMMIVRIFMIVIMRIRISMMINFMMMMNMRTKCQ